MTGRVLSFDAATHKVVDVLLPWFVNGTLEGDERALVQQHLDQCERCRREVEWLQDLQAACATAASVPGASPAVHHLRQRLMGPRTTPGLVGRLKAHWRRVQPWPRAVMATQLVAILVLVSVVASQDTSAPYRTLGAADSVPPAMANLVVVFDPGTTELDLRRALRAVGARIVGGPTPTNAYLLDVPPESQEVARRALKADRRVVLVEPLGAGNAR